MRKLARSLFRLEVRGASELRIQLSPDPAVKTAPEHPRYPGSEQVDAVPEVFVLQGKAQHFVLGPTLAWGTAGRRVGSMPCGPRRRCWSVPAICPAWVWAAPRAGGTNF